MTIDPDFEKQIDEAITHYPVSKRSASLPLLHLVAGAFRLHLATRRSPGSPRSSNCSRSISWSWSRFTRCSAAQPPGKRHIRVCRTLSCAMAGSYELRDEIAQAAASTCTRRIASGRERSGAFARIEKAAHIDVHNAGHGNPIAVSRGWAIFDRICRMPRELRQRAGGDGRRPSSRRTSSSTDAAELLEAQAHRDATLPESACRRIRARSGIVFKNIDREGWTNDIDCYLKDGGYEELKKALDDEAARKSSRR